MDRFEGVGKCNASDTNMHLLFHPFDNAICSSMSIVGMCIGIVICRCIGEFVEASAAAILKLSGMDKAT